jgi:hypothetical protein
MPSAVGRRRVGGDPPAATTSSSSSSDEDAPLASHRAFARLGGGATGSRVTGSPSSRASPGARVVTCRVKVFNLARLDVVGGTAEVDIAVFLSWKDPAMRGRTSGFGRTVAEYESLWSPKVEINNGRELVEMWDGDTAWNFKSVETGLMLYSQRYRGVVTNRCDLRRFPFDGDVITIQLGPAHYPASKVRMEIDAAVPSVVCGDSLMEWSCSKDVLSRAFSKSVGAKEFSNCEFGIVVMRNYGYYLWKIVLINFLVAVWSWTVFWMEPDDLGERMNTTLTLFLASVAFLFVTNDALPKVSYLTAMDKIILSSFLLLFLTAVESFAVFVISSPRYFDDRALANTVDWVSVAVFPSLCVLSNLSLVVYGAATQASALDTGAFKAHSERGQEKGTASKQVTNEK